MDENLISRKIAIYKGISLRRISNETMQTQNITSFNTENILLPGIHLLQKHESSVELMITTDIMINGNRVLKEVSIDFQNKEYSLKAGKTKMQYLRWSDWLACYEQNM